MKWPKEVIDAIALRRSVLFLGSGISANSLSKDGKKNPPTWRSFLCDASNKNISDSNIKGRITELINHNDLLTACELLQEELGSKRFDDVLSEYFLKPQYQTSEIHRDIFSLDSRIVMTPNVDKIYEVYAQNESSGTVLVKRYYDKDLVSAIKSQSRMVLKIHGTLDEPSRAIFSQSQYIKMRYEYESFYRILESLVLNYTFIFLGCGLDDPDIKLVLENMSFHFPESPKHYFVTDIQFANENEEKLISNHRNLEFISYSGKENHKELKSGIKDLIKLVEEERYNISNSQNW